MILFKQDNPLWEFAVQQMCKSSQNKQHTQHGDGAAAVGTCDNLQGQLSEIEFQTIFKYDLLNLIELRSVSSHL